MKILVITLPSQDNQPADISCTKEEAYIEQVQLWKARAKELEEQLETTTERYRHNIDQVKQENKVLKSAFSTQKIIVDRLSKLVEDKNTEIKVLNKTLERLEKECNRLFNQWKTGY